MRRSDAIRADVLTRFGNMATKEFADDPECNSVMMLVAQYWCDEAADQTHDKYLKSTRAVPLWPNQPPGSWEDSIELAGEGYPDGLRVRDFELVVGFAPYCIEDGSQEENDTHNYRPLAIATRTGGVELVGRVHRPWATVYGAVDEDDEDEDEDEEVDEELDEEEEDEDDHDGEDDMDGAARGRRAVANPEGAGEAPGAFVEVDAKFAALLRTRGEPDAHRVIADYLQEKGDPRGDLVALALTDPAAYEVRLLAHRAAWLGALAPFAASARFDRGLLVELELYGELSPAAIDSPLWASITHLHVPAPASVPGVLACDRPVTHLTILADDEALTQLIASDALPHLTSLTIESELDFHLDAFAKAPWRAQLRELAFEDSDDPDLGEWYRKFPELGLARLTIAVDGCWAFTFLPGGRVEVAQASFEPRATFDVLAEIIKDWEDDRPEIHAVRSRYWDPDETVRRAIADRGATVR